LNKNWTQCIILDGFYLAQGIGKGFYQQHRGATGKVNTQTLSGVLQTTAEDNSLLPQLAYNPPDIPKVRELPSIETPI
jgi:hypothetical protein